MGQTETVTQFVQRGFLDALQKASRVRPLPVIFGAETAGGDNGALTLNLGQPEYIFQDGHEEIQLSDAQKLQGRMSQADELFEELL